MLALRGGVDPEHRRWPHGKVLLSCLTVATLATACGRSNAVPPPPLPPPAVVDACLSNEEPVLGRLPAIPPIGAHPARSRVVDVTTLGAVPDDGRDDSAALAKIPAGVEALFPSGIFEIAKPVALQSGTTYRGPGTLKATRIVPAPLLAATAVEDVVVEGLTFSGGGLLLGGGSRNVRIAGNRFTDIADPKAKFGYETGIFVNGHLLDSEVTGNVFARIGFKDGSKTTDHGAGIQAYHLQNVAITGNVFKDVHQGISIILEAQPATGSDIRVTGNAVVNSLRMGIELWGQGMTGAVVEGNCVRARRSGDQDVAFSVVADGEHSRVDGNLAIQLHPSDAECTGMGIEIAGRRSTVRHNTIAGNWCWPIATYNEKGWSAVIEGNEVCGHRGRHPAIELFGGQGQSSVENNGLSASCDERLLTPLP